MMKPKKILLISLIVLLIVWIGGNLGLYLFAKHFLIGEDRLELFNNVPEIIEIKYTETDVEKIYFGDIEFILAPRGYDLVDIYPGVYIQEREVEKYSVHSTLMFKYANERKNITIYFNNTDQKLVDDYIEFSNYTLNDFSLWNTLYNYNSFYKLAAKWILLPSNNDLEKYPLYIVNSQYFKGFWKVSSGKKSSLLSFDFSTKENSYSIMLPGSDRDLITDNMKNIISSIKPFENKEEVTSELKSKYKNETAIFEKELALISLITIEGPTVEYLSDLKELLIEKSAREENIGDIQEQIDILKSKLDKVTN